MNAIHVLKLGGEILDDAQQRLTLAHRIALLPQPLLIVHGGGRQATNLARRLGVESHFHNGRRITDAAMLDVLAMTTAGLLNKQLVAALIAAGVHAVGMTALDGNTMVARRRKGSVDFGYVGDPWRTNAELLEMLIHRDFTPVIASLVHDGRGGLLNMNADTIAATIAAAFADRQWFVELWFCTPSGGVRDERGTIISTLTRHRYRELLERGIIHDGMLPKLEAAFTALERGVQTVSIIAADSLPHRFGTRLLDHTLVEQ